MIEPSDPNYQSVRQWCLSWLEHIAKPTIAKTTYWHYRNALKLFFVNMGDRADKHIDQLTVQDIAWFRQQMVDDGCSPKYCNIALKAIRIPLNLAYKVGLVKYNVAMLIKLLPSEPTARRPFTKEEITDLLKVANPEWQTIIMIALYTGARLQDCVKMRWEDVDLRRGFWNLTQKKTGRKVTLPLADPLWDHLDEVWRKRKDSPEGHEWYHGEDKDWVLPNMRRRNSGSRNGLSNEFVDLLDEAAIDRVLVRQYKAKVYDVSFHSFRHTFDSMLANKGVTREVREKLGVAKGDTHLVYEHMEGEFLREAVNRLPEVLEPPRHHPDEINP